MCVIVSLLRPRMADLKPMFERTERLGLIPFRHLLLIENILDLGALKVRDAMCGRSQVRAIRLDVPWEENLAPMRNAALPLGVSTAVFRSITRANEHAQILDLQQLQSSRKVFTTSRSETCHAMNCQFGVNSGRLHPMSDLLSPGKNPEKINFGPRLANLG